MTKILFSFTLLVLVSVSIEAKPNFIVILGDDVGWDAFGCTGMEEARTPAIDQLASDSCAMTRFYCSVSQCAPLRAELYTGLLPNNNGVLANARKESRPAVKNVADHLVPRGYRVGLTGKRHFGLGKATIDNIKGFNPNGNGSNQVHSFDGIRECISEAKAAQKSFCVFICSTHAHHPWDHGEESRFPVSDINLRPHYIDSPAARQAVAKHAAEVEVLDQQVAGTRELMRKMNLEKDTVLIFLSEQGIAMPRGKWSPYEHGSRALCLVHWKDQIAPKTSQALAMYCDIVPTLIDFADGGVDETLDGRSLRELLMTDEVVKHRDSILISNVHPFWQKAIVTDTYKLIWSGFPEQQHIWDNFYSKGKFFSRPFSEWTELAKTDSDAAHKLKRILSPGKLELYNVVSDPYETNDLSSNPEQTERIKKMHQQLKNLMSDCGESLEPVDPFSKENKKKRKRKGKK